MPRAADTTREADAAQVDAYRRMSGTEHVRRALARLLYGDDLARNAWPGLELLDP